MNEIIINNLQFNLHSIEDNNDVTFKIFENGDGCGQGLFSIQCFNNDDYYLYKWFDECNESDDDHCFPSCIESVCDENYEGDDAYYRIKITGVDEI